MRHPGVIVALVLAACMSQTTAPKPAVVTVLVTDDQYNGCGCITKTLDVVLEDRDTVEGGLMPPGLAQCVRFQPRAMADTVQLVAYASDSANSWGPHQTIASPWFHPASDLTAWIVTSARSATFN